MAFVMQKYMTAYLVESHYTNDMQPMSNQEKC